MVSGRSECCGSAIDMNSSPDHAVEGVVLEQAI